MGLLGVIKNQCEVMSYTQLPVAVLLNSNQIVTKRGLNSTRGLTVSNRPTPHDNVN
jgi:hypothetical protein